MGNLGKTYPRLGPKIDVRRECRNCVFFLRKGGIQSKPEQQKELYSYEGI